MAAVELLLLVAGWVCAVVHPATAERIVRLAERLPDPKWYWPNLLFGQIGEHERPKRDAVASRV